MAAGRILSSLGKVVATLMVAGMAIALSSCTTAEQNEVVARVNGASITTGELLSELRKRRGAPTLVTIIDEAIIHQAAEQAGISASEEEMELRWQRAIAEAGSETDMRAILKQRGISDEEYRRRLHSDLLLDKLVKASMDIPEQEIRDFYREHIDDYARGERTRARMILLASETDAQHIREALDEEGADFAGLAEALSIDPGTAADGGDMGWFERDDYARAITDVAFEMEAGEISDPIEVPDGWVLLKVDEHADADRQPLEEVRGEIRARIVRMKLPSAREQWVRTAREETAVEIHDSELREITLRMLEDAPPPQSPSLLPVPPPQ